MLLDAAGIECSTGSACTAGVARASHVLIAMGVESPVARGSLRFSLGHTSSVTDVDALIAALPQVVERARAAGLAGAGSRSEEHTSELQSLMRISYAVCCLKKTTEATKNNNTNCNK